jgi:hypothetical protein
MLFQRKAILPDGTGKAAGQAIVQPLFCEDFLMKQIIFYTHFHDLRLPAS